MAAKNGCNEAAQMLLAHGAFVEAKANVRFLARCLLYFFVFEYHKRNGTYKWYQFLPFISFFASFHSEWDVTVAPCCLALTSSRGLFNRQDIARI